MGEIRVTVLTKEDFDRLRRQAFFYGLVSGITLVAVAKELAQWLI